MRTEAQYPLGDPLPVRRRRNPVPSVNALGSYLGLEQDVVHALWRRDVTSTQQCDLAKCAEIP